MGERVLAEGQWMGSANRVRTLRWSAPSPLFEEGRLAGRHPKGWYAIDSTGATYYQRDFPHGLSTTDACLPGDKGRPLTPWPAPRPTTEEPRG